jgi:hypothetical protein
VNPGGLDDDEWARLFAEALWLEQWRLTNLAEMAAAMFGRTKN